MHRAHLAAIALFGLSFVVGSGSGCDAIAGYDDLRLVTTPPATIDDAAVLGDGGQLPPLDLATATIYSVYPSIFSAGRNLAGVTAALPHIRGMGFNVLALMPVTPIGQATTAHPTNYGSPYCVHDYYAINASYGLPGDLTALVQAAHALGLYVFLDEELNHTSWDNALVTEHPEYYLHSDGNAQNTGSIEIGNGIWQDVAQLDYGTSQYGLQTYMTTMLQYWLTTYGVDGFRFLTTDVPVGSPLVPASFWQGLRPALEAVAPSVVMWGDDEDTALAGAPFEIDDGWILRGGVPGATGGAGIQQVATGASATEIQQAWEDQTIGFSNVTHATFLETWDFDEDLNVYGGLASTMAAATLDFTISGVPMVWNGEEVGNDTITADDTTDLIDWTAPDAATLTPFYTSLLTLRNGHPALEDGAVAWVTTNVPDQVASFTRTDSNETMLVEINFSGSAAVGSLTAPAVANGWSDVSPVGSPGNNGHPAPPSLSLAPYDFAVFAAK